MRPRLRSTADRVAFLEARCRNLLGLIEYLETRHDDLRLRVRFLEEHAQLAQFKREDQK